MVRDSIHNIERNSRSAAQSAAAAAQHSAATAQAAQSAATGAWVGAGFQAVSMLQNARSARAAEEQLAVQRAMAEQAQLHQFAMWSQTPDGQAFVAWRERAIHLMKRLRDRQAEWLQAWATSIGQAQALISDDEKRRFTARPRKLKQRGLLVGAIITLVLSVLAAAKAGMDLFFAQFRIEPTFSYEDCITELADPDNFLLSEANCEAIAPMDPGAGSMLVSAILLALAVAMLIGRFFLRRAARRNTTVGTESQQRAEAFLFDPLAAYPGYAPFGWNTRGSVEEYADRLMALAVTGHRTFPSQAHLLELVDPEVRVPDVRYPAEVNELLARWRVWDGQE